MRVALQAAVALVLTGGTGLAQSSDAPAPPHHVHHAHKHAASGAEKPIDKGPTPGSDAAYQGGGVVLQGAPGAPAPSPQATPPGQAPAGSVPK